MIIVLYREDIQNALRALRDDGRENEPTALHFSHILNVMDKKELQAVSVEEHG